MSDSNSDRNLLFGVLALQMEFINRDHLIAAMNAWVLEKSKPLGQILLEHSALTSEEHDVLFAVVRKHIERHGGNPRESLIALGPLGAVELDLEQVADPDVHASLIHIATLSRGSPSLASTFVARDRRFAGDERFEILRPHASGGLGEVFVARDHQLNRQVALKRIHQRHAGSGENSARFLLEAEITGGLEHPGIVPVYGMGTSADGRPYYAMRLIRGETLRDAIARFHSAGDRTDGSRRVELRQLLGRFIAVCNAVEYAHSRGVIHRDLKPSNIMLGKYGETLVVDWGLVKAVGRSEEDAPPDEYTLVPSSGSRSSETLPGSAIGTPSYMSPEQAAGRNEDVGPASDVYSLGATLYTLLTGKEPFEGGELGTLLEKVRKGEFVPPREVNRLVPLPLNAICLKAMKLSPKERYPSCGALASDIEHWLADEPVTAFREPLSARGARWIKRHRGLAAGSAALIAAAFVGLVVGTVFLSRANARIAAHADEALHQRQVALDERAEATRQLYVSQMNLAQRAWDENNVGRARELLESQTPEHTAGVDLRGWEWHYLQRLTHSELRTLNFMSLCLDFTPDGRYLIAGGEDGTLKMWTADGTREVWTIKAHDQRIDRLAVSGDGKLVVSRSPDGTVKLWDVARGSQVRSFPGNGARYAGLAMSRDGSRLATSSNEIMIWSNSDGKRVRVVGTEPSSAIEFSPDANQLAAGSSVDFAVTIWDLKSGKELWRFLGHRQRIGAVAFSPDGKTLASGSRDGALKLWDVQTGREVAQLEGHGDRINRLVFSPDGGRLASACDDTTVKIWDTTTGEEVHTIRGHASPVSGVAFSPSGDIIATGSWDGTIRLWDAASSQEPSSPSRPGEVSSVAYSPDGKWLAAGGGGSIAVFDASTNLLRWSAAAALVLAWNPHVLRFDPTGRFLAQGSADGYVHFRAAEDGRPVRSFKAHDALVSSVDFTPDGRLLATGSFDHSVRLWDPIDGRQLAVLNGHSDAVKTATFSPDGRRLASVGSENDKQVILWDVAERRRVRSLVGHEGAVPCAVFSQDGRHLFTGSRDEMIRMWDVETGEAIRVHRGHSGTVHGLSVTPDGKRLASCGSDGSVKVWDVATGQELQTLKTNAGQLIGVAFSPDGIRLATGGSLKQFVVWDARPLTPDLRDEIVITNRVQDLYATHCLQSEVIKALEADRTISEPTRKQALELAQRISESPAQLNDLSWSIVKRPKLPPERYQLALRCSERACQLAPYNGQLLDTLGVAQYRVGRYAEAVETLSRFDATNPPNYGDAILADMAFLAMASHRLGQAGQAHQLLHQLRQLLETERWKGDAESQAFLKEAEELISPSAEAPVEAPRSTQP